MKTFLFQGDSITDANRNDDDDFSLGLGYPLLIGEDFAKSGNNEIQFMNRGVSGDRITDIYARIKEDIINLKPDYLSILVGVNDVSHELTMQCGVSTPKYEKIYGMMIEEIREALPQIKIIIMEPFVLKGSATAKLWEDFKAEVKNRGEAAKRVAEKYGLSFVELQSRFDEACANGNTEELSADGIHPTIAGHGIIKEELTKALLSII